MGEMVKLIEDEGYNELIEDGEMMEQLIRWRRVNGMIEGGWMNEPM